MFSTEPKATNSTRDPGKKLSSASLTPGLLGEPGTPPANRMTRLARAGESYCRLGPQAQTKAAKAATT
jgi:hypothetical protein